MRQLFNSKPCIKSPREMVVHSGFVCVCCCERKKLKASVICSAVGVSRSKENDRRKALHNYA